MAWQLELNGGPMTVLANTALADITSIAYDTAFTKRLNLPLTASFRVPCVHPLLSGDAGDGGPKLKSGNRALKIREDGTCRANLLVKRVERIGGRNSAWARVDCVDPRLLWLRRWARDAGGSIVQGNGTIGFPSPVSGPDIIKQLLDNSVAWDDSIFLDTFYGEWDTAVPPAVDLGFVLKNWPIGLNTLIALLIQTGVVDVDIAPVDSTDGFPDDIMGVISAKSMIGSDVSGSVHFDYATGDFNASNARHTDDMSELANRIWYYLGPRRTPTRWQGNINSNDVLSQSIYGTWHSISIYEFDAETIPDATRAMFTQLQNTEMLLRKKPRELLHITPNYGQGSAAGGAPPPAPFTDYDVGDIVTQNVGDALGLGDFLTAQQRIYEFTGRISKEGALTVDELVTSADQESSA